LKELKCTNAVEDVRSRLAATCTNVGGYFESLDDLSQSDLPRARPTASGDKLGHSRRTAWTCIRPLETHS